MGWLIPSLIFFALLALVLIGVLVQLLRGVEASSRGPAGGRQQAGEGSAPVLPWQRRSEEAAPDRPARGPREREASASRPVLPWQRGKEETARDRPPPPARQAERDAPPSLPWQKGEQKADRSAPLWAWGRREAPEEPAEPVRERRRDAPQERPAPGREPRCSTCGGTGRAIVHTAGGGLEHGPCPACQR